MNPNSLPIAPLSRARNLAKHIAWRSIFSKELPQAYKNECNRTNVNSDIALFVTHKLAHIPDTFVGIMSLLRDEYGMDVRFFSVTHFREHATIIPALAHALAEASYVFLEEDSDLKKSMRLRPDTREICLGGKNATAYDETATKQLAASLGLGDRIGNAIPVETMMQERNGDGLDISIVIPAYNAERTLARALDAILAQDYPAKRFETIVVDDCSSDETWNIAKSYESKRPDIVRIVRTPNQSGGPAIPRNLGIQHAKGEYVFFHDADDYLAPHALPRMARRIVDWNPDVMLVRMQVEGGRPAPVSMYLYDQPKTDLTTGKALRTLGPCKLFRRSLIERIHARFPEDCMPEDSPFVIACCSAAERVSVASDLPYYYATFNGDDNLTGGDVWSDATSNLKSYRLIFDMIESDPRLAESKPLLSRLLETDVAKTLETIANSPDEEAKSQMKTLRGIILPHYSKTLCENMPKSIRSILRAAFEAPRRNDEDAEEALARVRAVIKSR